MQKDGCRGPEIKSLHAVMPVERAVMPVERAVMPVEHAVMPVERAHISDNLHC